MTTAPTSQAFSLVDTHCHLDDAAFSGRLSALLAHARGCGVQHFVVPGVGAEGWDAIKSLADADGGIFPAFGIHPFSACGFSPAVMDRLENMLGNAVAVGEIGLDYSDRTVPRNVQQEAFRLQVRLAVRLGMPVLIHCRSAFSDLLTILRDEGAEAVGGVMHAFSGSVEIARECIALGFLISVAGPVTYRNAVRPRLIVQEIPLASLVLETDSPDLSPEPYRGRVNEPAHLIEICKKVNEIKGIPFAEVAEVTTRNARTLFGF